MISAKKTSEWVKKNATSQITGSGFNAGGSQIVGSQIAVNKKITEPLLQPEELVEHQS